MNNLILACQLLPLAGILLITLLGQTEARVAGISLWVTRLMGVAIVGLLGTWTALGFPRHEFLWFTLYQLDEYQFPVLFYFDRIGAAYLFCTWLIFSVIVRYCRHYLHREPGYRRFFLTIFGFVFGLNLVILSGVLDMFFAGWEIVGISSFLLIAFYRHRYQPIRNALRAYSIYRLCDFGLLLGALLIDLLLHGRNHFSELAEVLKEGVPPGGYLEFFGLSLLLILAAAGKSAQFPFCFWIPRAMEGPTPSSAIFYGALSVHLGVFLLLRTQPIWGFELASRGIVFAIGALTVLVASLSEQAQSNIKGQVAYASITQVGFMFIELALGLETLVLLHFLGNAFLRCYQLLVSPSVVAHLLRVEGEIDEAWDIRNTRMARSLPMALRDSLPETLRNTLLVVALQEFNLDTLVRTLLWDSFRNVGMALGKLGWRSHAVFIGLALAVGGLIHLQGFSVRPYLALLSATGMLYQAILGFTRKRYPLQTWNRVGLSTLLAGVATWFSSESAGTYVGIFLSGILAAWLLGWVIIRRVEQSWVMASSPFQFRALDERKPGVALLLFLAFLGLVGFPITPAFLGQDLVLFHISGEHAWMAPLIAISLVLNGISASGVYMRLCAGRPVEVHPGHVSGLS
jgi:NADH:ubiquinone oxidoreductase subunit 5 (subunit L)/multisubunit Na+/H+ antiporter MnhA subunit